jgi:tetratricopeptide (TPR) repeat protein
MLRTSRQNILTLAALMALTMLSCSKGYNKHADEYYEQGRIFYENMEYGRSAESFTKVLELAPAGEENNRVYYMRGRAYLKNRQYDPAIYDFTKALELTEEGDKSMRFLIHQMRGDSQFGKSAWIEAFHDYSKALMLVPEHENAKYVYLKRGWTFLNTKDPDAAIKDFGRSLAFDPAFAEAYYSRANAWLLKQDSQRALSDAKQALKLQPNMKKYDDFVFEISSGAKPK